jgi:DoxX-like family
MNTLDKRLLRASLVLVWLLTAVVSVWELQGQSMALLRAAGMVHEPSMQMLVWLGSGLDLAMGLALWCWPRRWVYGLALGAMLGMTVVATVLLPSLWLHPLGPLLKNIPIAALLWVLAKEAR